MLCYPVIVSAVIPGPGGDQCHVTSAQQPNGRLSVTVDRLAYIVRRVITQQDTEIVHR